MKFYSPLDAVRHAAYRAMLTGSPWGVYDMGLSIITAPLGQLSDERLLEVCHP